MDKPQSDGRPRRGAPVIALIAFAAAVSLGAGIAIAAGEPDPGLGPEGLAVVPNGSGWPTDVLVQPDGRILVAGMSFTDQSTWLIAMLPNGELDTSFSGDGVVTPTGIYGGKLALQEDGRILLAVRVQAGGLVVHRVLENGTPDPAFGSDGSTAPIAPTKVQTVNGIGVQADGRIVIGLRWGSSPEGIGLVGLTPGGALDSTFGASGIAEEMGRLSQGFRVADDDSLLASGFRDPYTPYVMRFTPDGALDTDFGTDGEATTPEVTWGEYKGLAELADGTVLATGIDWNTGGWVVSAFTAAGLPKNTFATSGSWRLDPSTDNDFALGVAVDGSMIYVTGSSAATDGLLVARLTSSGLPDTAFSGDGLASIPASRPTGAQAVAVQPDHSVVVVGARYVEDWSYAESVIGRYVGDLLITPSYVDFGSIGRGVADTPIVVTVENKGTATVAASSVTITGASAADFSVQAQTCTGASLPVGAACTVTVGFTPGAIGARDATLTISGAGAFGTRQRRLHGIGLDPVQVAPDAVAFGDLAVGLEQDEVVTVSNIGPSAISVVGLSFTGVASADYAVHAQSCTSGTVAPGSSCSITVRFSPSALGTRSANLVITGPGAVGTRDVDLAGTGTDPVSIDPDSLDFGTGTLWQPSPPMSISVSNVGGDPFTISAVAIEGVDATDFLVTSETCTSAPVAPSGSCSVDVSFTPGTAGHRSASLSITGPGFVGTREVPVAGTAELPPSNTTWGSTLSAGAKYTWNGGGALGRSVKDGSQLLHLTYATNRIGGSWAKDAGPYIGVYYIRSGNGGSWTAAKRLNPTSQHAMRIGLAAAGTRVYVTWVSQTRFVRYSPTAPRVLYVRVNSKHGSGSAWGSTVRLSSKTGRVDYPTIAADGTDAHIAWTNSGNGEIRISSTRDRGVTWRTQSIGTTSISTSSGRLGLPSIAVSGAVVGVAWLADDAGTIKMRVSTDRGVTWGPATTVGSGSTGAIAVAARGDRVAVAWTTAAQTVVRVRTAGTWAPALVLGEATEDGSVYGPAVVLQGAGNVAVAWSDYVQQNGTERVHLRWRESPDGTTWFPVTTVASGGASAARRFNDWPSVIWPSAGTRLVVWNGWTPGSSSYRLYFRQGSGTTPGPAVATAVAVWDPKAVESSTGLQFRALRERR